MPGRHLLQNALLSSTFVAAFAATAYAQNVPFLPPLAAGQARVTLAIIRSLPVPGDTTDEGQKVEEDGRRSIYELAGHECSILRDTIASDCHIESISINVFHLAPIPNAAPRPQNLNLNANIVLRIVPK